MTQARGRSIPIYATLDDLIPGLTKLEESLPIAYVRSGVFHGCKPVTFASFSDIPGLGTCPSGDSVRGDFFLIVFQETEIAMEEFKLKTGETRFALDHAVNPESVIFSPGGTVEAAKAIIQGSLSKLGMLPNTELLYKQVLKHLTAHFIRRKGHRIGPNAARLSKEGYRLTPSLQGNLDYDFQMD